MQSYVALTARSSVFVFESLNNRKIFQVSGHLINMSYATTEQSKFSAFETLSLMILLCLVCLA